MKSKSIIRYSSLTFSSNSENQQKRTFRFFTNTICLLLIIILLQKNAFAQTLGINTSGVIPDSSAMLDIISADKGLLIPRISLISTTDTITISNPATSLLVYNTNDTITGGSGLGYYYFNGSMWMNFLSGTDNSITAPLITGGSGTTSSLTYKPTTGIGTTGADHVFQVGNNGATEAMRILNSGNVGIGTASPGNKLHVVGNVTLDGLGSDVEQLWKAGTWFSTKANSNIFNIFEYGQETTRNLVFQAGTGNVGIGLTSPSAKLHTLSTTEQLRLGYDASNYYSTTVGSTGAVTFNATGSGAAFTFSDAVTLPTGSIGVTQSLDDSTTQLATTAFVDRAVAGASGGSGWGLTGTSGTTDGTNFIGTTDNIPFNIKVNNQKAGRIDNSLENVFLGYQAGNSNSSGYYNTAIGNKALYSNTTGTTNTAVGSKALYTNTTGSYNTATGQTALNLNTTGSYNTATGQQTLLYNTTGSSNTATGMQALAVNTTGGYNTATGYGALNANTTGTHNTAVGYATATTNTTGYYNTNIGHGANVSTGALNNATSLGAFANVNANNKVRLGNSNVTVIEGQVAYTSVSDGRFKKNISESDVKGLSFIMRLRPVVYNIDTRQFEEFLVKNKPDSVKVKHFKNRDFTASTAIRHSGFVAQEVEAAAEATNYNFGGLHKPENADDNYGLAYAEFVVPLVKAVQEQQQELNAKDSVLISLQNQIDQLKILVQNKNPK